MAVIKEQTKWVPPEGGGAPLLTMPNIPMPLHGEGCQPRTIIGKTEWDKMRRQCYADADDVCEISGVKLNGKRGDTNLHHSHELFEYDYETLTATFIRPVCISPTMHNFIHSGRAITCYKNHEKLWDKTRMLSIAEAGFKVINQWNRQHPDDESLRVYETVLSWLDEPSLHDEMQALIDQYQIEFWGVPNRSEWDNAWGKWKLVYNGNEYYSPYQSRDEWEEKVGHHKDIVDTSLFSGDEFEELRRNIKEMKDGIN